MGKYIKKKAAGNMMKMNSLSELCTVITQLMVSVAAEHCGTVQ